MKNALDRLFNAMNPLAGWLAVLTPVSMVVGKAAPDILLSVTAGLFLLHVLARRSFGWAREPWVLAALLLWSYGLIRTALAGLDGPSLLAAFSWVRFILFAVALATWILPQAVWRKRLFAACFAVTAFLAADALLQYVVGYDMIGNPKIEDRLTSVFRMPKVGINIAWLCFPVFAGLLQDKRYRMAAGYGLLCFTAILLSGDRFALLYTLSLMGLLALFDARVRKPTLLSGLTLVALSAAAMFALPELYHRQFESTLLTITHLPETHYGVIWARVIEMIKDHPVFGIGVHHYRTVCLDPIYGPLLAGPQHNLQPCALHPHNTYLEWFVETGTVGLALYLAFAVCVFRALAQSFAAHKKDFLYIGLMLAVGMRFWPLASTPSFHIAWAVMSFWLLLGWSLSYTPKRTP